MVRGMIEKRMKSIEEYMQYNQTLIDMECLLTNKYTLSRMSVKRI